MIFIMSNSLFKKASLLIKLSLCTNIDKCQASDIRQGNCMHVVKFLCKSLIWDNINECRKNTVLGSNNQMISVK